MRWAESLTAKSELPRLIRRLVLETGVGVTALDFPASEGTATGGWDGVARAAGESSFVPQGMSLWELSAGKSTGKKADTDFAKRTRTPDGSPAADATYCAVSVRRWRDRRGWAAEKTGVRHWKDVRAYGVDALETWLEAAPVTHAWISELLGLKPYGMRTAEAWWRWWSTATEPILTAEIVLAGRSSCAKALRGRLSSSPQLTTLRADSLDEALAFVTAVVMHDEDVGGGTLLATTTLVDDVATWRSLADHPRPLVMVAITPEVVAEARAAPFHHVIVPLTGTTDADIELPPIDSTIATTALREAGLADKRADDAGQLARRSLLALRRHLARKPELHTPVWALTPVSRLIRGVLLAGSWDDESPGDQERLATLTGKQYDELREDLAPLASADDPFITRVDRVWSVVSPFDAWRQLGAHVRHDDLQRLRETVERVLLEPDPAFGAAPEDALRASIDGRTRQHSAHLRTGLATTISLLGALGERVDAGHGADGVSVAGSLVHILIAAANDDSSGAHWATLAAHLRLLAEGAPDAFLDGVRSGASGDNPVLTQMFSDDERLDPLFASSPHTGLLWALEVLAWSPEHFAQSVYLLARLSEIDPGGRLVNRPTRSLESIFCPWHPDTTADIKRRLDVLDELRRRHPVISWRLMLELLPESHGIHHPNAAPRFRDWQPSKVTVTNLQWLAFVTGLVDRLVGDAGAAPLRWQELLDDSTHVSPSDRSNIRAELHRRVTADELTHDGREALWDTMRKLIAQHREHSTADWALPTDDLDALEGIERLLRPQHAVQARAWLFEDHMPDLGDASKMKDGEYDHAGYTAALEQRRSTAVAEIFRETGWPGIVSLAARSVVPWSVGYAFAETDCRSNESECLSLLTSDQTNSELAGGYCASRFRSRGWAWVDDVLTRASLVPEQKARLLLVTADHPRSWQRADELGADVAAEFWKLFSPFGLGSGYPYTEATARRLLGAMRPGAALRLLTLYACRRADADPALASMVADALDDLLQRDGPDAEQSALDRYELECAFQFLEGHVDLVGTERVALLEWRYLPALGHEPEVPSLHRALATDPTFFVELLSVVYKPLSSPKAESSAEQQVIAENAYRLLSSWSQPPGTGLNGSLDGAVLRTWATEVLSLLDAADRRAVGELHIGHVLAHAPADPDGAWPCVEVRDLLEDLQLEHLEQGLESQVFNNRGITSRGLEEGGEQERDLARSYRAAAGRFNDRWPRTAAVLRSLAQTYETDARREDADAERHRKGLNR